MAEWPGHIGYADHAYSGETTLDCQYRERISHRSVVLTRIPNTHSISKPGHMYEYWIYQTRFTELHFSG